MWENIKFKQDTALNTFIVISGSVLLFLGVITMSDHLLGLDILSGLFPDHSPTSPISALFFIVSGLFLVTAFWKWKSRVQRLIFLIVIALFSIHGLIQFINYLFRLNQGSDILFNPINAFLSNFPFMRMSPFSGLLFFLSSLAFGLKCRGTERIVFINIICSIGIIVGLSGFIAMLGYIFGTPSLCSDNFISLAPASAFAYLLLGSGLVTLGGPESLFLRPLIGSSVSARVLRAFLPLIIAILVLQGILNVLLTRYFNVNPALLLVLLTVFSIILSVWMILRLTRIIFQIADKAEKDRSKAEETLVVNEKKYRYLFENNPQPMWIYDLETLAFLEVNDYAIQYYGYSRNEFLNMTIKDIRPANDESALLNELNKVSKEFCRRGDWQHKKKNGEIIFVEINSHAIDYEGRPARLVLAADITRRKMVEITLKESEAKFRELFDQAPLGYHELDLDGKIIRVNQTEFEMLGYSRDEMLGKYAWEFIIDQETSKKAVYAKIANKKSVEKNFERLMFRKDGTTLPVLMEDLLLFDENGNCTGIRTAVQDITERQKTEIEIRRINKELTELNATKDKFFSIIGHDLRGPIGGFKALIEMMITNFDLTDTAMLTKTLKIIQSSASSTFELLENLLTWARSQRDEIEFNPENVSLNEITALSMKPLNGFAHGKQINIIDNLPQSQYVYADPNMLMTILRNLISNAIKFTHPGKNVYLSAIENDKNCTISIKDEGIGIKSENLYKIFDSSENFTTSGTLREKGSGLGLLLCKEFVKKHGGEIWVVSDPEANSDRIGSEFLFTLPKLLNGKKN